MSIVTVVLKDTEVAAEKVLSFLAKTEKAEPQVIAALGVLLGAVGTAVTSVQGAAAAPLNVQLDQATFADIKAVWPDVKAFAATLGIKL
jgi:hypothetical protein